MARNKNFGGFDEIKNDSSKEAKPMDFSDTASNVDDLESEEQTEVEDFEKEESADTEKVNGEGKKKFQDLLGEDKADDKSLHGFYLEPDIVEAIEELTKNKKRGAKSKLANLLFRQALEENGIL